MLYQLSYKATQLGARQFFELICSRKRVVEGKKYIFEVWVIDER